MRLKNQNQIDGIRESGEILAIVLDRLKSLVEPGISLYELDMECRRILGRYDATPVFLGYNGFPGSICTSVNEQVIHGFPTKRKLHGGDIVSIDCGVVHNGYVSDAAVTVPVGEVRPEIETLLRVTQEALELGIQAAHSRGRVHDISRAIYRHVAQHNYGVVRPYCGHGVGFDLHEDPQVPNYVSSGPNPRLRPGLVIAVEPMINLGDDDVTVLDDDWTVVTTDGSVSAHFEHTIVIREDSTEVLTKLPERVAAT